MGFGGRSVSARDKIILSAQKDTTTGPVRSALYQGWLHGLQAQLPWTRAPAVESA